MQLGGCVPRHRLCLKCLEPNSTEENVQFGSHWLPQNISKNIMGGDVPLPQISACYLRIKCTNGEASRIETNENQTNQEQQLKGLVDERMKEIKSIAQKKKHDADILLMFTLVALNLVDAITCILCLQVLPPVLEFISTKHHLLNSNVAVK
ncbi:hypothetical protein ACSBR1_031827 [Camellia fascicularis]